jgi:hypothetical protein
MAVKMKFTPVMVLGFPAVVIDRASPSPEAVAAIRAVTNAGQAVLPTAFLGKVAQLTHNVHQQGGTTDVTLSHCRTHRSVDDEFLGVLHNEDSGRVVETRAVSVEDLLHKLNFTQDGQEGPPEQVELIDLWIVQQYLNGTLVERTQYAGKEVTSVKLNSTTTVNLDLFDLDTLGVVNRDPYVIDRSNTVPKSITVTFEGQGKIGKFTGSPDMRVEDALTPDWFSDIWQNENITEKVYGPLLGTTALTDDTQITSDSSLKTLVKQLFEIDVSGVAFDESAAPPDVAISGTNATVTHNGKNINLSLGSQDSIERAIDGLVLLYSTVKKRGLNTHEFIRNYTARPVATMPQILGSFDLEFDTAQDDDIAKNTEGEDKGVEGFHSRAFGDYNTNVRYTVTGTSPDEGRINPVEGRDALGLWEGNVVGGKLSDVNRDSIGKKIDSGIPGYMDPRGRAQQRVLAYMAELRLSRGLVGA